MNLAWYVARASGLVSWTLLAASVVWGLLLVQRRPGQRPGRPWMLDLHRFFGGLAVVFVGVHLVALLADSYVTFTPLQLLVPFTSTYRPLYVAFGIVGLYLLVAIEVTSLAMKRLSRRAWKWVHLGSYGLYVLATAHLLLAGSDASNPVVFWTAAAISALVVFLTVLRVSAYSARHRPDDRVLAVSGARPARRPVA